MNLITLCYAAGILAQVSTADDPSAVLEGISADASSRGSPDQKRDSEVTVLRQGVPAGPLLLVGPAGDPAGGVQLVQDSLEPLLLPPVVDVFPDVPDRVGDTPLQVQTVIEAEPADDDEPLDVPWVWDDKVCSPLLNRAPPPAGPLTTEQVTFALPLVVRERNRLKLKTRSGAVSPLHSDEAASTFEKLFWCITALIARVREPEERTRLMKKLYQDYLLWMERDEPPRQESRKEKFILEGFRVDVADSDVRSLWRTPMLELTANRTSITSLYRNVWCLKFMIVAS
ncbi:hypothetical protein FJT64_026642 [Amphibalanus amphitrite]|uniref:Uncharacterized protein n=1 Tax=Amphibalanus amphitrite TaxID=1232801 RepID=A0A6A4WG02_AMPAM|nr:hypothetical protein FJT64_026642 [Amphibalanus amphitrite]